MAIDFGRMARGVATGYLSAKIANTEANDQLKADILKQAGTNFYTNTLPQFQKQEQNRKDTYSKVKARYGADIANYMDQNNFTNYDEVVAALSEGDNFNEAKLKAYLEATKAGTYAERAEKRFKSMEDQQNFVMNNMTKSGFGTNTLRNQLGFGMQKEEPMAPKAEGIAPVPPTAAEDTTTTKLPSFEEIFGDSTDSTTIFINMGREDQVAYRKLSDDQFKADTLNEVSGMRTLQEGYKEDYQNLSDSERRTTTLNEYARERYFREKFLPQQGLSYSGVAATEPLIVKQAKYTINILKANDPNDPAIDEIKSDLRQKLGTNNLSEYGL